MSMLDELPPVPAHPCARDLSAPRLTSNELRLLEWLAAGRTNAQIAQCANRSGKTVSNQLTRIYEKLGVVNRTEAVAVYLRGR